MPIPSHHIVTRILSASVGGFSFFATIDRLRNNRFKDIPYEVGPGKVWGQTHQPHGCDLYFTPLRFNLPDRKNEAVGMPGVLFADLDPVNPANLFPKPSIAWKTSEYMYQAVWLLDAPMDSYDKWANLNQRLTHHTGADRGGWPGAKLLRVPASVNWKRRDFGTVLWYEPDRTFKAEWMDEHLDQLVRGRDDLEGPHPPLPTWEYSNSIIRKYWKTMRLRTQSMLMQEQTADRSLHIVKVAYQLADDGVPAADAFGMLWQRPWNKWRTDKEAPGRLWTEVLGCYNKEGL